MEYHNENFNGELDFRCKAHDAWQIDAHLHEYSEILFCKSGRALAYVGEREIALSENQLVWIPPNYVHRFECRDARVICAVFSSDLIPLYAKVLAGRHLRPTATDMGELCELLVRFPALSRADDCLTVSGYLNLILSRVMASADFDDARGGDGDLYQKVISYVAEHYAEDISLGGVAKEFGYHEKYLSHALHELTGIHFRGLLNFYRLRHAKSLLEKKRGLTVAAVAAESGFGAVNTFNREFRRAFGETPSEYRRRYAQ